MKIERCIITKFGRTCTSCIKSNGILNAKNLIKLNDYFVGYFIGTLAKIILQDIHLKLNNDFYTYLNYNYTIL